MAEGFLRALGGDSFLAASAGTQARGVHPLARRAMAEVGIDISTQTSKTIDELAPREWDAVVTVCDSNCPIPPKHRLHLEWSFPDPSAATGTEEERLAAFRIVRDGIFDRVRALARELALPE